VSRFHSADLLNVPLPPELLRSVCRASTSETEQLQKAMLVSIGPETGSTSVQRKKKAPHASPKLSGTGWHGMKRFLHQRITSMTIPQSPSASPGTTCPRQEQSRARAAADGLTTSLYATSNGCRRRRFREGLPTPSGARVERRVLPLGSLPGSPSKATLYLIQTFFSTCS
jgi:hypothetical protein